MTTLFRVAIACSTTLLLAGCGKSDQAAKDSAAAAAAAPAPAPAPPPPAPFSLTDAAGKWQIRAVPESGTDTTATTYVLTATADTTGWDQIYVVPTSGGTPVQISKVPRP